MADRTNGRQNRAAKEAKRAKTLAKRSEMVQKRRTQALADGIARQGTDLTVPEEVKLTAARLYGAGMARRHIARALVDYLAPNSRARTPEQKLSTARQKLKKWEMQESFRNMVWNHAVVALDMAGPDILLGVARSAKRGRVDAARLALEITGRHTKDEQQVTNVTVQLANIPRPSKS